MKNPAIYDFDDVLRPAIHRLLADRNLANKPAAYTLAGIFLPFVSKHGYSSMFFLFASFTLVYFLVAALFLPETKGKTLEEIEAHFEGQAAS